MAAPSITARGESTRRALVHVGLLATATVSLVEEPVLTLHIALGLLFVGLTVTHLVQRRRVSATLLTHLRQRPSLRPRSSRLAAADLLLLALTTAMLASGLWDWLAPHHTRIRWHAISGVLLAGLLLVHTVRRRRRLLTSNVR